MKLKYKLPNYARLNLNFDIEKLKKEVEKIDHLFTNVYDANGKLCANHHVLATEVHSFFDQINLTTSKNLKKISTNECDTLLNLNSVKNRLRQKVTDDEILEKNYNIPEDIYKNSYFEEIINSFKSPAIRVRLTKLKPNKSLIPHIDYDPSYAVRIIIPIISNPGCINQFWRKNKLEEVWLKNDGSCYFLNTGVKHSVKNISNEERIALMFSLDGIEDIKFLIDDN